MRSISHENLKFEGNGSKISIHDEKLVSYFDNVILNLELVHL